MTFGQQTANQNRLETHFLQADGYFMHTVIGHQIVDYTKRNFLQGDFLLVRIAKVNEKGRSSVIFAEK